MTSTLKVQNIQYTDGDAALTIADGGGVTLASDLTVDTSTLKVDSANNRVGIGTASPGHDLEIKTAAPEMMLEETSSGGSKRLSMGVTSGGQPFINAEQSGGSVAMNMTGTEVAKFQSTGLAFPAGKGIDFSASADGAGSSISEVLTDYEHGTWTPVPEGGQTIGTVASAFYQKIGQMVYVGTYFSISAIPNNSGQFYFGGLPFAVASGSHYHAAGSITYVGATDIQTPGMMSPTPYSGGGDEFYFHRNSGSSATVLNSQVQGLDNLILGFWYYTTA